jgi:hypothetical protein
MPPSFSENVTAVTVKVTWMIHTSFAIMMLFFQKVPIIFSTLLPALSKTVYTSVVKFFASISEHITTILFQFVVVSKVASFSGPNRWQSEGATSGL